MDPSPPSRNAHRLFDANSARTILQRVSWQRLKPLADALLESLQSGLWERSDRAASNAERTLVAEEIGVLARAAQGRRFQEQLRQALLDPVAHLGSVVPTVAPTTVSDVDLALVEQDSFEVSLATEALANRLEHNLEVPLRRLRRLAAAAFPADTRLPLEPAAVAAGLVKTLVALGMGPTGQRLCLGAATDSLTRHLGTWYRELIRAWEEAGAAERTPPPATRTLRQPVSPRAEAQDSAARAPMPQDVSGTGPELPAGATAPVPPARYLSRQQVLDLLATMPGASPDTAQPLRVQVDRLSAQQGGLPLEPRVQQRVDAADGLLEHMRDDPLVAPDVKEVINRLSRHILAGAVAEPALYGSTAPPMMDLIDRFEHLTDLLPRSVHGRSAALHQELDALLQRTLAAGTGDRSALGEIVAKLGLLEQRFGDELQRGAARVVATCEGRERMREARREVHRRIQRTLGGRRMHRATAELLAGGWGTLLQLTYLREGGSGAPWRRRWEPLLALHAACGGEPVPASAPRPATGALLDDLRDGLAYIGFDPFRRGALLERLEMALKAVQAGTAVEQDFLVFQGLREEVDEVAEEAIPEGMERAAWGAAMERVNNLAVGAVMQLREAGGEQTLRLVWRSRDGHELMALDPAGLDARSLRRSDLAAALLRGEARVQEPLEQGVSVRAAEATLREMQERIAYHETRDALTGLKNRRQLMGELSAVLASETDRLRGHALGFIDLDHFEDLTATLGYMGGERLLVAAAKTLENHLEDARCIAYLGGHRFALLAPAMDEDEVRSLGERTCSALAGTPYYWNGTSYRISGSVGLVLVGSDEDNPGALLSAADSACLAAQHTGGGRVTLFHEGDEDIARQREKMRWWVRAEQAVKAERLRLRCQRIARVDAIAGPPLHHEVLLSVYDENNAELPLGEFIGAAEAFGLMAELDRLVLSKALDWLHAHPREAGNLGGLAVNLSGQSLDDSSLVDFIRDRLTELAIPAGLLSFEVTETAAIANLDRAVAIIAGIRALGCRVALDDFGTGMSSYSYLKRLPVDYLKIDGSFVRDILNNPQDHAIVKSINETAHFMGKQTIAEYAESPEIITHLRNLGVDHVQGYALERPFYLDEIGTRHTAAR